MSVIVNINLDKSYLGRLILIALLASLFASSIKAQSKPAAEISVAPFAELLRKPVVMRP